MPVCSFLRFTPASYRSRPALRRVCEAPPQPVVVILAATPMTWAGTASTGGTPNPAAGAATTRAPLLGALWVNATSTKDGHNDHNRTNHRGTPPAGAPTGRQICTLRRGHGATTCTSPASGRSAPVEDLPWSARATWLPRTCPASTIFAGWRQSANPCNPACRHKTGLSGRNDASRRPCIPACTNNINSMEQKISCPGYPAGDHRGQQAQQNPPQGGPALYA